MTKNEKILKLALELAVIDLFSTQCEYCPLCDNGCIGVPEGIDGVIPTERCESEIIKHYITTAKERIK